METLHKNIRDDTRGASIIIALVFFLICAIVGSVVLTAASVQAKAVSTHTNLQRDEFTVGSAAQTLGHELESAKLAVFYTGKGAVDDVRMQGETGLPLAFNFWNTHGKDILTARGGNKSYSKPLTLDFSEAGTTDPPKRVFGELTVDPDLNITIALSLDSDLAKTNPYKLTVSIQCIPTYDAKGMLTAFAYEPAVVTKTDGSAA